MIDLNKLDREPLTKEALLKHIKPLNVYEYYTGEAVNLSGVTNSPLREDKSPSFGYFISKSDELCFHDFVEGGGDFVKFVSKMFNLNYNDALSKIAIDFRLDDKYIVSDIPRSLQPPDLTRDYGSDLTNPSKGIVVKSRPWREIDERYWSRYNISYETLIRYNISPISYIFLGNRIIKADPIAYSMMESKDNITYKIYQPFSKNLKWLSNHDFSVWQGWSQLPEKGENLIITSSLKDVMCLWDTINVVAVSLQAESVIPKESVVQELKDRFDNIYILYDNDYDKKENYGRNFGKKLAEEFNFKQLEIPSEYECTDYSDLVEKLGPHEARKINFDIL